MNYKIKISKGFISRPEYRFDYAMFNSSEYIYKKSELDGYHVLTKKNIEDFNPYHVLSRSECIPDTDFLVNYCNILSNNDSYIEKPNHVSESKYSIITKYKVLYDKIVKENILNSYLCSDTCNYIIKKDLSLFRRILNSIKDKPLFTYDTGLKSINDPSIMLLYLEAYHTKYLNEIVNQFHYLFM